MVVSARQQAILNMVKNNKCIPDFINAQICTYEFFQSDYSILNYVLEQYKARGVVSFGDLVLNYAQFQLADLEDISTDVWGLINRIKGDYAYDMLTKAIKDGQTRYDTSDTTFQFLHYLNETTERLLELEDIQNSYGIIAHASERFEDYQMRAQSNSFIPTGFKELDNLIGGWSKRDGELASFLARMGMGKTWVLLHSCTAAWTAGFKCGIISIEMTPQSVGTRIDTLLSHMSNTALRRGSPVDLTVYTEYLDRLKKEDLSRDIIVKRKRDFNGHITPTKIENWIREDGLDILYLDGIGYVESERFNTKNKSEASMTTDVSEDLMAISGDMHCPVIITQQANRSGADRSANPGLDSARGSDGVNINASFVASLAYPDVERRELLRLEVLKSRYGTTGDKFNYIWNPNIGTIQYEGEGNTTNGQSQAFFGNTK